MKIALGTVQFGINYGISNSLGQVKDTEAEKILQYAFKQGVNTLDTASSYGNSEDVISDFLCKYSNGGYWNIITKTPNFKGSLIDNKQLDKSIESFKLSQKKLGEKNIYGLLIHNCNNLFLPGGEKLLHMLEGLKKKGVIKKIGVSLYSSEQIDFLLDNYSIDLVQLPVNILDQRLIKNGRLDKLKKYNVEIHARSAFLQGLLLMPLDDIPSWFDPIKSVLKVFHKEAKERNMSILELALGFVQSIHEIDKVVVGVNSLDQFKNIIDASSINVNIDELSHLSVSDSRFLNPSNWRI
jgi:aryl-alcohol dehydrogenase-like predicted oxidoreductase